MMKTQNQLERELVKSIAKALNITNSEKKKIISSGFDMSKCKDEEITPDGYVFGHAECVNLVDEDEFKKFARSLSITHLLKASAECIQKLSGFSKAEVDSNNIFTAIRTKNGNSQMVIFWKRD